MKSESWRASKGLPANRDTSHDNDDLRPGDRNEALEARHLSKYVFPLQYNLKNAFFSDSQRLPEQMTERFSFMDREFEIDVSKDFA